MAAVFSVAVLCPVTAFAAAKPKATPAPAAKPAAKPAEKTPCDLIVVAGGVLTMDPSRPKLSVTAIVIQDGRILDMAPVDQAEARYAPKEKIERRGAIVMPGLVNTHTHAAMCLMRGLADDKPLKEWLEQSIFPVEGKLVSPKFVKDGTLLACLEMIRGGTTTFADMYYYESSVAEAVESSGMRAVLGESWLDFPTPGHKDLEETKTVTRAFLERWKGNRRITAAVAPHAPYTCNKETLLAAKAMAEEFRAPILIHLSETKTEQKTIQDKYGMSPTKWLDSIGFLGPNVLAAHGVWCDADDLKILAAKKVSLSHNPESNMKLASGVAPVVAARAAGVVVGLGTDGVAGSNNDLDMFESMDFAGKLAKVTAMDPTVLPAHELLKMATIDGARALKMEDSIGSLEIGKYADLIAVESVEPHLRPIYDVESSIVYSAKMSDVSLTVVDGRVLWDRGRWLTIEPAAVMKSSAEWREVIQKAVAPAPAAPAPAAKPK